MSETLSVRPRYRSVLVSVAFENIFFPTLRARYFTPYNSSCRTLGPAQQPAKLSPSVRFVAAMSSGNSSPTGAGAEKMEQSLLDNCADTGYVGRRPSSSGRETKRTSGCPPYLYSCQLVARACMLHGRIWATFPASFHTAHPHACLPQKHASGNILASCPLHFHLTSSISHVANTIHHPLCSFSSGALIGSALCRIALSTRPLPWLT